MIDQETLVSKIRPWRRSILLSVALNIFLICVIAAYLLSSSFQSSAPLRTGGPGHQFEMLAARLPQEDAAVLKSEFDKKASEIEEAHTAVHRSQDALRLALRAEPYNAAATQEAISQAQAPHHRLEKLLQEVIASAAAKMTAAGRAKLADWEPGPRHR